MWRISITVLLTVSLLAHYVFAFNQSKALCFAGSSLYQLIVDNCNDKDPSYTGEWYCAKMTVCESFKSSARKCIETRGCATAEECSPPSGMYDDTLIQPNGFNPAGMETRATCCSAYDFPDDDTVAINYEEICNSGSTNKIGIKMVLFNALLCLLMCYWVNW